MPPTLESLEPKPAELPAPVIDPLPLRIVYEYDLSVDGPIDYPMPQADLHGVITLEQNPGWAPGHALYYRLLMGTLIRSVADHVLPPLFRSAHPGSTVAGTEADGLLRIRLIDARPRRSEALRAQIVCELEFHDRDGHPLGTWQVSGSGPRPGMDEAMLPSDNQFQVAARGLAAAIVAGMAEQPAVRSWLASTPGDAS